MEFVSHIAVVPNAVARPSVSQEILTDEMLAGAPFL